MAWQVSGAKMQREDGEILVENNCSRLYDCPDAKIIKQASSLAPGDIAPLITVSSF